MPGFCRPKKSRSEALAGARSIRPFIFRLETFRSTRGFSFARACGVMLSGFGSLSLVNGGLGNYVIKRNIFRLVGLGRLGLGFSLELPDTVGNCWVRILGCRCPDLWPHPATCLVSNAQRILEGHLGHYRNRVSVGS